MDPEKLAIKLIRRNRTWGSKRVIGALANLGFTLRDSPGDRVLPRTSRGNEVSFIIRLQMLLRAVPNVRNPNRPARHVEQNSIGVSANVPASASGFNMFQTWHKRVAELQRTRLGRKASVGAPSASERFPVTCLGSPTTWTLFAECVSHTPSF